MNGRFFITGLPRSRTAWMTELFNTRQTYCFHEPIKVLRSLDRLENFFILEPGDTYKYLGVADSGLGFHIEWILTHLKPRTLIIQRPLVDVEKSLAKLGFPRTNQAELLEQELDSWADHELVRTVPYALLDNPTVMARCWFHLCPGLPFDEARFRELCTRNIQADLAQVRAAVAANQAGMQAILGDVWDRVRLK